MNARSLCCCIVSKDPDVGGGWIRIKEGAACHCLRQRLAYLVFQKMWGKEKREVKVCNMSLLGVSGHTMH